MALTWRNVNAPNFSASNQLLVQGGQSIADAFKGIVDYGKEDRQNRLDAQTLERSLVTQGLQDEALEGRILGQESTNKAAQFNVENMATLLEDQLATSKSTREANIARTRTSQLNAATAAGNLKINQQANQLGQARAAKLQEKLVAADGNQKKIQEAYLLHGDTPKTYTDLFKAGKGDKKYTGSVKLDDFIGKLDTPTDQATAYADYLDLKLTNPDATKEQLTSAILQGKDKNRHLFRPTTLEYDHGITSSPQSALNTIIANTIKKEK